MTDRFPFLVYKETPAIDLDTLAKLIAGMQLVDGRIPWSPGDKTDPWDHVESAMGLTVGGVYDAARRAYAWLRNEQLPDGSWYSAYDTEKIRDHTRETNHAAYPAVGLYHYYLATGDLDFTVYLWPMVERAISFVLGHQGPEGQIWWAISPQGKVDPMALLTGNSSIYFSLKCAVALADLLHHPRPHWRRALRHLGTCLRQRPHCFNMTKSRFAMDWYYPVLCGALTSSQAEQRISKFWKKFVVQNLGVRCVSDHPWVTVAESCELVLTLWAMGNHLLARILMTWIGDHLFEDGTFWCGFTYPDMTIWPEEKISWTNAAMLLAADAVYGLTPAAGLFEHCFWREKGF